MKSGMHMAVKARAWKLVLAFALAFAAGCALPACVAAGDAPSASSAEAAGETASEAGAAAEGEAETASDAGSDAPQANDLAARRTGEVPLLILVVGFDGGEDPAAAVPFDNGYDWAAAVFGPENTPASYYRDMSGGMFQPVPAHEGSAYGVNGNPNVPDQPDDGVVHVQLHRPHGAWGTVNEDRGVARDFAFCVVEALRAASIYVDYASYDADGDGVMAPDELTVGLCIAGYEASALTDYGRSDIPLIWSHSGTMNLGSLSAVDGIVFDSYIAIAERYWFEDAPLESAEQEPLGVFYHELGHVVGLPDLYPTVTTEGAWAAYEVGPLSLMATGGWQETFDGAEWSNIPTALDAWSRYVLGWSNPTIVAHSGDYAVSSQLSDAGYSQLIIPTSDPDQYYLIENRQPEGHDISLSAESTGGGGLTIWHVDNAQYRHCYGINQMNDANHRPAVMPQFVEHDEASWCSQNWATSWPDLGEPFFDAFSWNAVGGGEGGLRLPLYSTGDDVPAARGDSGITLQFVSGSARDMVVHIELDTATAARNATHLFEDEPRDTFTMAPSGTLERIAAIVHAPVA